MQRLLFFTLSESIIMFTSLFNLSYTFPDGTLLFNQLNAIFAKKRIGIIGRNGIGKYSLFKLITGKLLPVHESRMSKVIARIFPNNLFFRSRNDARFFKSCRDYDCYSTYFTRKP
jgi:ABC-type molybdenum transport system ATPase subunit/photorepair protein PhrA